MVSLPTASPRSDDEAPLDSDPRAMGSPAAVPTSLLAGLSPDDQTNEGPAPANPFAGRRRRDSNPRQPALQVEEHAISVTRGGVTSRWRD